MESPERHEERIKETEEKVKGAKDHGGERGHGCRPEDVKK
jgi:hypothetical protein